MITGKESNWVTTITVNITFKYNANNGTVSGYMKLNYYY